MTLTHFIIGLKAGIGKTFQEAELALTDTKKKKEKINSHDTLLEALVKIEQNIHARNYAISHYTGPTLEIKTDSLYTLKHSVDFDVLQTMTSLEKVLQKYGPESLAYHTLFEQIEKRCLDHTTSALTPFGYHFKLATEIDPHRHHPSSEQHIARYRIIVDGNDMHYWNDTVGYDAVTDRLKLIGQTLVNSTRKTTPQRVGDLVFRPPLVSRMHGSAGDEFFIDMYARPEHIEPVIYRLFDKIYAAQYEIEQFKVCSTISSGGGSCIPPPPLPGGLPGKRG